MLGRLIASRWILLHRLQYDVVQITFKFSSRLFGKPSHAARLAHLLVADDPFRGCRRYSAERVWTGTGQKLKQQNAERIDIGCSREFSSLQLFRTRVVRS